jgi:hypothetical protein
MNAADDVTTMTDCGACVGLFVTIDGKSVNRRLLVAGS